MQNKLLHIFYKNSNLILKVLFQQLCHCHALIVLSNQSFPELQVLPGHRRVEFMWLSLIVYRNKEFLKEIVEYLVFFKIN